MPPVPTLSQVAPGATHFTSTDPMHTYVKVYNAFRTDIAEYEKRSGSPSTTIPTIRDIYASEHVTTITVTQTVTEKVITSTHTGHPDNIVIPMSMVDELKAAATAFAQEMGSAIGKEIAESQKSGFLDNFSKIWSTIKDVVVTVVGTGIGAILGIASWKQYARVGKEGPEKDPNDAKETMGRIKGDDKQWLLFKLVQRIYEFFGGKSGKEKAGRMEGVDELAKKKDPKDVTPKDLEEAQGGHEMSGGRGPGSNDGSGSEGGRKKVVNWLSGKDSQGSGSDRGLDRQATNDSSGAEIGPSMGGIKKRNTAGTNTSK
ncbi:MAG: hypothetical protein Q9162_004248 [Coniocarpon cinnabarinum]